MSYRGDTTMHLIVEDLGDESGDKFLRALDLHDEAVCCIQELGQ